MEQVLISPCLRFPAGVLAFALLITLAVVDGPAARAQMTADCSDPFEPTPEEFGPTDITAVTGNQHLSVGLNSDATVSVFKWPSPSYYDQIKYRTTDREEPLMGAEPNEGSFIGIAWKPGPLRKGEKWGFAWLREWPSKQSFVGEDGDEVKTLFTKRKLGLRVSIRDVVSAFEDSFVRDIAVKRTKSSNIRKVRVFSFANFNPVVSKIRQSPTNDWCTEEGNDSGAAYLEDQDVIVHNRSGVDESTGLPSTVSLAMGLAGDSDGFHVGPDTYESTAFGTSAYDDAGDGRLLGGTGSAGQADGALFQQLALRRSRTARSRAILAAGAGQEEALATMELARSRSYRATSRDKKRWWSEWLQDAAIPRNAPASVRKLAKRALISIRQTTDPSDGLIAASVATQSPLGLDWVRNGAYINRALHLAGHPEMVEQHNRRYGELQASSVSKPPGGEATPPGNWSHNFYLDGVVGGRIPYAIDATGLGIWTLWDHYALTQDRDYLVSAEIYEAIQRGAHYLSDDTPVGCRDRATGLQCAASEEENPNPTQTLRGAQAVWLGLDAAARAARVRGGTVALANADKWEERRDEIAAAIRTFFFSEDCKCYTTDYRVGGTLLWPVQFEPANSVIADSQAEENFKHIRRAMKGREVRGELESRALLGNAYVWTSGSDLRKVKKGLRWVAENPTTDETGILGEAWMVFPPEEGTLTTMVSQPHVWNQAMFYLAAIKAYGQETWRPRG
jgi:GH15 family glucan-1,4-alpha-glucosidase